MSLITPRDDINREADLICEAILREIDRAGRWSHVTDAWKALLTVRRMEKELTKEQNYLSDSTTEFKKLIGEKC